MHSFLPVPLCWVNAHTYYAHTCISLFGLALNPTGADVPAEYQGLLEAAAADMRATQGLLEGETPVPRGFVGRGMPLRTLQELAQHMHALHSEDRRRRLEEL